MLDLGTLMTVEYQGISMSISQVIALSTKSTMTLPWKADHRSYTLQVQAYVLMHRPSLHQPLFLVCSSFNVGYSNWDNITNFSGIYTPAETASTQNTTTAPVKSPDELLHLFRSQFMVHFPYAVISSDVTATELHGSQPWLYRMIMMAVSSHERYEQIEAGKSLISELSTTVSLSLWPQLWLSLGTVYETKVLKWSYVGPVNSK